LPPDLSSKIISKHFSNFSDMDDQNDLGAKNNEIIKPNTEASPSPIITNPIITTTSIPLIKRRWFRVVLSLGLLATIVTIIAGIIEIPNGLMNWYTNWKTLFGNKVAAIKWQPPELPRDCKFISVVTAGQSATNPLGTNSDEINLICDAEQDAIGAFKTVTVVGGHVENNRFYADVTIPGGIPFGPFKVSGNKMMASCHHNGI